MRTCGRGDADQIAHGGDPGAGHFDDDIAPLHLHPAGRRADADMGDDDAARRHRVEPQPVSDGRRQIGNRRPGKGIAPGDFGLLRRRLLRRCDQRDARLARRAVAQIADPRLAADALGRHPVAHGLRILDIETVDRADDIADPETGPVGRTAGMDLAHNAAARPVETERLGQVVVDRLQLRAEPGPLDMAAIARRGDDALDHVGGNGKADADAAAALRIDGAVDADKPAIHRHQRAARIAGIDGRIGLDEELIVGHADMGARQRRDDAAGHRLAHAEGIADGENQIADLDRVGILEAQMRQLLPADIDLQHRQIRALVGQHQLRIELAPVGQRHRELLPALDHVMIGDDQTRRIDDHAGTERLLHPFARHAEAETVAEELLEEGIVEERRARTFLHDALGVDIDHRRRDPLDHRCVGQLHLGPAVRQLPLLRSGAQGQKRQGRRQDDGGQRHRKRPRPGRLGQHFNHHDPRPRTRTGNRPPRPDTPPPAKFCGLATALTRPK